MADARDKAIGILAHYLASGLDEYAEIAEGIQYLITAAAEEAEARAQERYEQRIAELERRLDGHDANAAATEQALSAVERTCEELARAKLGLTAQCELLRMACLRAYQFMPVDGHTYLELAAELSRAEFAALLDVEKTDA